MFCVPEMVPAVIGFSITVIVALVVHPSGVVIKTSMVIEAVNGAVGLKLADASAAVVVTV